MITQVMWNRVTLLQYIYIYSYINRLVRVNTSYQSLLLGRLDGVFNFVLFALVARVLK